MGGGYIDVMIHDIWLRFGYKWCDNIVDVAKIERSLNVTEKFLQPIPTVVMIHCRIDGIYRVGCNNIIVSSPCTNRYVDEM